MGIFCLFYQPKLAALASQELPEPLAKRVERHLQTCPDCLSEWALQQRMTESLRGAAPAALAPSPYLWENLEATIRAEAPTPAPPVMRPSWRRLAPLGGVALASVAMAAVVITRPSPQPRPVAAAPQATPEAVQIVAIPKPSPSPQPPPAVLLANASEGLKAPKPTPTTDPFEKKTQKVRIGRPLPRIASGITRRKRLPELTRDEREESWVSPTRRHGVAVIEVGMNRVVEDSQTEEFNRMVAEAERNDLGLSARASSPPTEALATASAQNTRGLFQ